jgi:hypothetical protein
LQISTGGIWELNLLSRGRFGMKRLRWRSVDYFLFNYDRSRGSVNGWRLVGLGEVLVKAHVF